MKKQEEIAHRYCYDKCSAGEFIDPENGVVSKSENYKACTSWKSFLHRVAEEMDNSTSKSKELSLGERLWTGSFLQGENSG